MPMFYFVTALPGRAVPDRAASARTLETDLITVETNRNWG
jgi:hypothetical protein